MPDTTADGVVEWPDVSRSDLGSVNNESDLIETGSR